jgi:lipopolysaccharide biosynthesis protein
MPRILILYVFHIYNQRVNHFINNAIIEDDNVDYIIISNNKNIQLHSLPSYVKTLYRDNIGYDFGGWSDALLTDNLYQNYDYFICVNSSVIGPYLPPNYTGKWYDIYINGLKDNVKLFGSTINTMSKPETWSHVQSYIFSMDKNTLEYLIKRDIFSFNYTKTFNETILKKEILMSRKIIENGWNIGSLLSCYKNVDFTFSTKKVKDYKIKFLNDVINNKYYGSLWNRQDLIFVKGNRNVNFNRNVNVNGNVKVNLRKINNRRRNRVNRQRRRIFRKLYMRM